jgi:hypothetical protein
VNRWRRAATLIAGAALLATAAAGPATAAHQTGSGFDACVAQSTGFMRSWLGSPFRTTNIYLPSSQLASDCRSQPELNAQWVHTVRSNGWALLPVYVGLQAPCRDNRSKKGFTTANARSKGRAAAVAAIDELHTLRIGKHNPVYVDLEPYDTTNSRCSAAVVDYVEAWTLALHHRDYISGVYAHATRGIEPIALHANPRPNDVWWALFNGNRGTSYPTLHGRWKDHRIHQYATESTSNASTYNSQGPLQIDKNTVRADVVPALAPTAGATYRASTPYDQASQAFLPLKERQTPSTASAVTGTHIYGDALAITCQTTGEPLYGSSVWDKLSDGGYVFDLYTTTTGGLSFTTGIPRC